MAFQPCISRAEPHATGSMQIRVGAGSDHDPSRCANRATRPTCDDIRHCGQVPATHRYPCRLSGQAASPCLASGCVQRHGAPRRSVAPDPARDGPRIRLPNVRSLPPFEAYRGNMSRIDLQGVLYGCTDEELRAATIAIDGLSAMAATADCDAPISLPLHLRAELYEHEPLKGLYDKGQETHAALVADLEFTTMQAAPAARMPQHAQYTSAFRAYDNAYRRAALHRFKEYRREWFAARERLEPELAQGDESLEADCRRWSTRTISRSRRRKSDASRRPASSAKRKSEMRSLARPLESPRPRSACPRLPTPAAPPPSRPPRTRLRPCLHALTLHVPGECQGGQTTPRRAQAEGCYSRDRTGCRSWAFHLEHDLAHRERSFEVHPALEGP